MKIVLARVDDRLIHGQVVIGWTRTVGGTHIVVADDETANNSMQRTLLKMATPAGVTSTILSVDDAAKQLLEQKFTGDNVILLVKGPQALVRLIEAGINLPKVNVGNIRASEGKVNLTKGVYAGPEEIQSWKKLDELGVVLEAQWLPDQAKTNLNEVIRHMDSK